VRRVERGLVAECRSVVHGLLTRLGPETHARAVEVAALPDLVRGYEHVKLESVICYREQPARAVAPSAPPATGAAHAGR
jgi:indolepyruvate ferredoxin oxidoreductase